MTRPKPLILVVDDDDDIRRSLSRELALAGYDIVTAADGVEGRELFEHQQPDLVVTDMAMPREDGFAVISAVRLPGERERAERLRQLYRTYKPALDGYFTGDRATEDRRRLYFGRLLPLFQQIKDTADEILLMNQRNMEEADQRARDLAQEATRRMTLLLVLGTALAALSVYLLSRSILRPLGGLARAAREIEAA